MSSGQRFGSASNEPRDMRKLVFGVSDQVRAAQSQKMARGFKFRISEIEGLCYIYPTKKKRNSKIFLLSFPFNAKMLIVIKY